jgi:ribosome maturation factor RimP
MTDDVLTRIRDLVQPSLTQCGVELFDAQWDRRTADPTLRLLIDRPGGVSLDDCERVSTAVAAVLDAYDPIVSAYHLEVSSPGAERPLRNRDDWHRHIGRRVNVRFGAGTEGETVVEGTLLAVADDAVVVETRDRRRVPSPVTVPWSEIRAGRLAVEI